MLNREDFNNDKIDAGEIGAGHTVTAIYEITPTDSNAKLVDDLRYGTDTKATEAKKDAGSEYAFLKIRYKLPNEEKSKLLTTPIDGTVEVSSIANASTEARFATSVAAFGQLLRGESQQKTSATTMWCRSPNLPRVRTISATAPSSSSRAPRQIGSGP